MVRRRERRGRLMVRNGEEDGEEEEDVEGEEDGK